MRIILLFKIHLSQVKNKYEFEELIKVFLKTGEYHLIGPDDPDDETGMDDSVIEIRVPDFPKDPEIRNKEKDSKNQIKRYLYKELHRHTGEAPDWGILTGVRPVKLAGELLKREGWESKAREILIRDYYITEEKADLLMDIVANQGKLLKPSPAEAVGLYIGIPFCPTRCVYCSFPSNLAKTESIAAYLSALHQEISFTAEKMQQKGWYPESIYIGGGTPTTLSAEQLDGLLKHVAEEFDLSNLREFTVEAGRPDTITGEKLDVII